MTRAKETSCRVLLERLSAYLDGDLPDSVCRRIESHAKTCPRCTEVLDDLRKTTGLCRSAGQRPVPPAVKKIAREHVRRLLASRRRRLASPPRRPVASLDTLLRELELDRGDR
jgi:anti-sigma factor RsiW